MSHGTCHMEQVTWNRPHGTGHMEQVTWNRSHGTGHMEQVTWNRSHGTGHMEQVTWNRTLRHVCHVQGCGDVLKVHVSQVSPSQVCVVQLSSI